MGLGGFPFQDKLTLTYKMYWADFNEPHWRSALVEHWIYTRNPRILAVAPRCLKPAPRPHLRHVSTKDRNLRNTVQRRGPVSRRGRESGPTLPHWPTSPPAAPDGLGSDSVAHRDRASWWARHTGSWRITAAAPSLSLLAVTHTHIRVEISTMDGEPNMDK